MFYRSALLALSFALTAPTAHADGHLGSAMITAPDRPFDKTCFRAEHDTLSAAMVLEEIEGEAIDISGYGDVTTAEGESWGFLIGFTGILDGAVLTGKSSTVVEGTVVEETIQWAFVDGGVVTEMGTFAQATCLGIEEEYINRVVN